MCRVKEYETSGYANTPLGHFGPNDAGITYEFMTPPATNRDHPMDYPFKTVKKEYLVVTWMSLIGNIGGTLGVFVGFSLIGFVTSATEFFKWFKDELSRKIEEHHYNREEGGNCHLN